LTAVLGQTELLMERLDTDSPLHRQAEKIARSARRGATLTSQLLALSRKQVLRAEVLDLNAVISSLSTILRRLIGEDIEFSTLLDPQLGGVRADGGQLEQVILNLVVNARDAMPRGGKLTNQTTRASAADLAESMKTDADVNALTVLAVTDNGCGMDAATQAR